MKQEYEIKYEIPIKWNKLRKCPKYKMSREGTKIKMVLIMEQWMNYLVLWKREKAVMDNGTDLL